MRCAYCSKPLRFWQSQTHDMAGQEHTRCWHLRWAPYASGEKRIGDLSARMQGLALLHAPSEVLERWFLDTVDAHP